MNRKELKNKKTNILMIRINTDKKELFKKSCNQEKTNMSIKLESLINGYLENKKIL